MAQDDEVVSGFEVEVEYSDGTARDLGEVAESIARARTEAEALSRASADFTQHLREASEVEVPAFSAGGGSSGPPAGPPGPTSAGPAAPEPGSSGSGSPGPQEIEGSIGRIRESDPDLFQNIAASREALSGKPGGSDESDIIDRTQSFSNVVQSILAETGPGGSISQTASSLAGGLGSLAGNSQISSLLGTRGLGALGAVGGGLAMGVAANAAYQATGEQMQAFRDMGSVQGGGITEGIQYESQIRTMALNPFLNTQQSREIIMSALSSGYTGKEFDTVTDFMASNLKDMQLSVAESTEILTKNVSEGGQSIQSLSDDLARLKTNVEGGVLSLEERQKLYQGATSELIDQGISGASASGMALTSLEVFEDDPQLSGVMSNILQDSSDQLIRQAGRERGFSGPTDIIRKQLGEEGTTLEATYEVLRNTAMRINSRGGSKEQKQLLFKRRLASLGINLSQNDSDALFEKLIDPNNKNAIQDAQERGDEEYYGVQDGPGKIEGTVNRAEAFIGLGAQIVGDTIGMLNFGIGDENESLLTNFTQAYSSTGDAHQNWSNRVAEDRNRGNIAALDQLNEQYGAGNIEIITDKGKRTQFKNEFGEDRSLSKEDLEKISSGEWKVSVNGGEEVSLRDVEGLQKENRFDDGSSSSTDSKTNVSVQVEATDELKGLLRFNTRTANQERADAGFGDSRRNDAPPGDK